MMVFCYLGSGDSGAGGGGVKYLTLTLVPVISNNSGALHAQRRWADSVLPP